MAKCELKIVLDEVDREFRPGETVTGRVDVTTDGDVTIDALTVELAWQTHGKGNRTTGVKETVELYAGEVQGGMPRYDQFQLTCPPGPFTYHGTVLNVDWVVRARADIPWKIDPKAEEKFVLRPPERPVGADFFPTESPRAAEVVAGLGDIDTVLEAAGVTELTAEQRRQAARFQKLAGKGGRVFLGCFFAPFLVIGLVMLVVGLLAVVEHFRAGGAWSGLGSDELVPLGVGAMFFFVPGALLLFFVSSWIASRRLGEVTFEIAEPIRHRGQTVEWRLALQPPKAVEIEGVQAKVVGREKVVRGSGTHRTTHTHVVVDQELEMAPARSLMRGEPFEQRGSFVLPADAPLSFKATDNALEWEVQVTVEIPRWPDWRGSKPFVVVG
jgi:hypothetical protein